MSCAERHRFEPQPRLDHYHLPCTASVDSLILSNSHSHRLLIYGVGQNKKTGYPPKNCVVRVFTSSHENNNRFKLPDPEVNLFFLGRCYIFMWWLNTYLHSISTRSFHNLRYFVKWYIYCLERNNAIKPNICSRDINNYCVLIGVLL